MCIAQVSSVDIIGCIVDVVQQLLTMTSLWKMDAPTNTQCTAVPGTPQLDRSLHELKIMI